VTDHGVVAAAATLVSLAFGCSTLERWRDRRVAHELAWTVALGCFAGAAAALWWGAEMGWSAVSFRIFYALGAVVNVPILALGTVLLLGRPALGRAAVVGVGLFSAFGLGVVLAAPIQGPIPTDRLPQGSAVFGVMPRVLAAVGSGVGATVLFGGAVWSIGRLVRGRGSGRAVLANVLIVAATGVLSAGGLLNSVVDEMTGFALTLVVGISVLFAGFLVASTGPRHKVVSTPSNVVHRPESFDPKYHSA
jgi:hypothetical protein